MVDFISRDEFAKYLADIQYGEAPTGRTGENIDYQNGVYAGLDMAYVALKKFPAADVRPVVHGEWMYEEPNGANNFKGCYWCDKCHQPISHKKNFCPNCGCAMENEK